MKEFLVKMQKISKTFPGVLALNNVDFNIKRGEILGFLGENGAGKSTLMKVLTGVYQPDGGNIIIDGKNTILKGVRDAYDKGISIIFQEFNLCSNLSAMENLFLGNEICNSIGFVNFSKMKKKAIGFFNKLKIDLNPSRIVKELGVAQQQMVEIAKAISYDVRLLIMDEPTSSLADNEIKNLFKIMNDLKSQGVSIIFITHKLQEVLEITDRIVVLRDGENVGELLTKDASENKLISMMVGRGLDHFYTNRKDNARQEVIFEVKNLSGKPNIKNVSFKLYKGEILGLAGLVGAGRTELAKIIIGYEKKNEGEIFLGNKRIRINSPVDSVRNRIAYLSEDRKNFGLILQMSVRENISMSIHKKISNLLNLLSIKKENELCDNYINNLNIKVSSKEQIVNTLSGGNQQKVVISKWLATKPLILILDEPTRGIDVGAKAEVHRIITELADNGVSIILISSELPEILALSDRVLVMHDGVIKADMDKKIATQENIMKAAISSINV